jgi:hypothetical protein
MENIKHTTQRYYIANSSIFDNPQNMYDYELFKKIVKENGGKYIYLSNCFGWSNQPKVVAFTTTEENLKNIENALNELPVFEIWGCIIREKDW